MKKIIIVPIEPIDTRYTRQWYEHLPKLIKQYAGEEQVQLIQIEGDDVPPKPTEGAFLDFAATNIYKSSQINELSKMFHDNEIADGDHIVFTDAWNPGVINVKYMKDLLGIDVKIHGLWHAGSYDPQDFLGRLIEDKRWSNNFEKSLFFSFDYNWYATEYHIDLFTTNVLENSQEWQDDISSGEPHLKLYQTGWPMEYMADTLSAYKQEKTDTIVFPHRIAPEKQPEIFRDLQNELPEYNFVVCQDQELTKEEYHNLLGEAKIVFSANLQETLGISAYEGILLDAIPVLPNRLSYVEMYDDLCLYPNKWTNNFDNYQQHKADLIALIRDRMDHYDHYVEQLEDTRNKLTSTFFSADNLLKTLFTK